MLPAVPLPLVSSQTTSPELAQLGVAAAAEEPLATRIPVHASAAAHSVPLAAITCREERLARRIARPLRWTVGILASIMTPAPGRSGPRGASERRVLRSTA